MNRDNIIKYETYLLIISVIIGFSHLPPIKKLIDNKRQEIKQSYVENRIIDCFNQKQTKTYNYSIGVKYDEKLSYTYIYIVVNHDEVKREVLRNYSIALACVVKYRDNVKTIAVIDHYFFPFYNIETNQVSYELRVFGILKVDNIQSANNFIDAFVKKDVEIFKNTWKRFNNFIYFLFEIDFIWWNTFFWIFLDYGYSN